MGIRPAFGGPARQAVNALAGYARNGVSGLAALALNAVTGLAALVVLALVLVSGALVPVAGLGRAPLGLGLVLVHRLAAHQRRWAGRVLGEDGTAGSHRRETDQPWRATLAPEPRRRGTRRELGWLAVHLVTGPAPVAAMGAMLAALDYVWFRLRPVETSTLNTFALSLSIVAIAAVALMAIPLFRIGQARLARRLLDGGTATDTRIRALTASRAAVVDARAAELRRIERDLHDGAQAKLIAVRMHLGLARGSRDPDEMVRLIDEARQVAGQALTDLRDLVRGIHPPVLSDRGSGAAGADPFAVRGAALRQGTVIRPLRRSGLPAEGPGGRCRPVRRRGTPGRRRRHRDGPGGGLPTADPPQPRRAAGRPDPPGA
ncbi:hypothetical protein GCM10022224_017100 [Nonomuraea antimicrobica]|uniref:histidine kinase n=1 Tax=Nonomuraea antimicrobica TaxID=561173 RepID=A0ABP7BC38_9ACTN